MASFPRDWGVLTNKMSLTEYITKDDADEVPASGDLADTPK